MSDGTCTAASSLTVRVTIGMRWPLATERLADARLCGPGDPHHDWVTDDSFTLRVTIGAWWPLATAMVTRRVSEEAAE